MVARASRILAHRSAHRAGVVPVRDARARRDERSRGPGSRRGQSTRAGASARGQSRRATQGAGMSGLPGRQYELARWADGVLAGGGLRDAADHLGQRGTAAAARTPRESRDAGTRPVFALRRAGWTLPEMLITLVLTGAVLALAAYAALSQLRFFVGVTEIVGVRTQIGHATAFVARAARALHPAAGD